MKYFLYKLLIFIILFLIIYFYGNLDIKTIFKLKEILFVICGGILFSIPSFANVIIYKDKSKTKEYFFSFVRNIFISGIFVSLILLPTDIKIPHLLSSEQRLTTLTLQKIFLSLRPLVYGLIIFIIFGTKEEKTVSKNTKEKTVLQTKESKTVLSKRETEVAKLAFSGLTNLQIAEELYISPETVKRHLATIYSKTGINSRRQLGEFLNQ